MLFPVLVSAVSDVLVLFNDLVRQTHILLVNVRSCRHSEACCWFGSISSEPCGHGCFFMWPDNGGPFIEIASTSKLPY